jgi:hypothetical protein
MRTSRLLAAVMGLSVLGSEFAAYSAPHDGRCVTVIDARGRPLAGAQVALFDDNNGVSIVEDHADGKGHLCLWELRYGGR